MPTQSKQRGIRVSHKEVVYPKPRGERLQERKAADAKASARARNAKINRVFEDVDRQLGIKPRTSR